MGIDMITHDINTKKHKEPKVSATQLRLRVIMLSAIILILCTISLLYILIFPAQTKKGQIACIYQDGSLIQTIDLSTVQAPYSFVMESQNGGTNTLEVRPGSIGITDADCPDKLCVSMGFANSSLLPIICLPHGLVIEIKESEDTSDAISY